MPKITPFSTLLLSLATLALFGMTLASADAATAERTTFGQLQDGRPVPAVILRNGHGLTARIIAYGAMLQSLKMPDRHGNTDDIVIGYDSMPEYQARNQFTGVTVGRYANRIARGHFSLDGKDYTLAINNPPNALHGGPGGFWSKLWTVESVVDHDGPAQAARVTLTYVSPDGEEGYPGTMTVAVTYSLDENNDLTITYKATTDKPTVLNLTNHSLFNLAGVMSGRNALDATMQIDADAYLPTDETAIPTGEIKPVKGSPFDFTQPRLIRSVVRDASDPQILLGLGIDHNYVLRGGETATPKSAATVVDTISGRAMRISTTEPGLQVYTGNFLDGKTPGKGHWVYRMGDALALESQHFPDSPNHPEFPSTRLNPGQVYRQVTVHHFYTVPGH